MTKSLSLTKIQLPKVMLVAPPGNYLPGKESKHCVQPLGIAYIAAVLEQQGYPVVILDSLAEGYDKEIPTRNGMVRYGLTNDEISHRISEFSPDIVGVSCLQSTRHHEALDVISLARKINPSVLTVMGGPHATASFDILLKNDALDLIVLGEGEKTFSQVCAQIAAGKRVFENVPGLALRENGVIKTTGSCDRFENLDELPFPAYHLLPMAIYSLMGITPGSFVDKRRFSIMVTSRGCPNGCRYCPADLTFGKSFRGRSIESVIAEIRYLKETFEVQEILFEDSNFLYDRQRVIDLCLAIREEFRGLHWSCPHGLEVSRLDDELLVYMADSGCDTLYLAVETPNLSAARFQPIKKVQDAQLRSVVATARRLRLRVVCFFMLGFPWETKADLDATVAYAASVDLDYVCFFCATPLPGTPFLSSSIESGIVRSDFDIALLRYSTGNISTDEFSGQDVERRRCDGWAKIMAGKKIKNNMLGCG